MGCNEPVALIALVGELGSGKTQLTKFFGKHLGVTDVIQSPTFVLMKHYIPGHTFEHMYHFDWYRLHSNDDVYALGWNEIIRTPRTLVVVEWADRLPDFLPQNDISY